MIPPLAICVPTHNRAGTLAPLLAQLAAEAPDVPLLVSDNASSDDTPQLLAELARPGLIVHRQRENVGAVANIRWLLANAPEAGHVWLLCDDDRAAPGAIDGVLGILRDEDPDWLHLPHRWVDPHGEIVNRSPCPPMLERYPDAGSLFRAYGHWLTFGSAAVIRRDALVAVARRVDTRNAYAPLVWFANATAGACAVAPFCGVVGGTEITWADQAEEFLSRDFPALYEEVFATLVDREAFAAALDTLYGDDNGMRLWRSRPREQVADVQGRFPSCRTVRFAAAERAGLDRDTALLAQVVASVSADERTEAFAARESGEAAFSLGDTSTALGLLGAAVLADPADPEIWSDLGVVRHAAGRIHSGIEALTVALGIDPGHADAQANLDDLRDLV